MTIPNPVLAAVYLEAQPSTTDTQLSIGFSIILSSGFFGKSISLDSRLSPLIYTLKPLELASTFAYSVKSNTKLA